MTNTNTSIDEFLAKLGGAADSDKLFILVCASELFRRTGQIAKQHGQQAQASLDALGEFAVLASSVPWDKIPFSFTHTLLVTGKKMATDYGAPAAEIPSILLRALGLFVDLLDSGGLDPAEQPEQILYALIAELSEQAQVPVVAQTATTGPEIYQSRMISRVFKPKPVTDTLGRELSMTPVLYKTDFGGGKLGPDIRGLAFENGTATLHVILETGEYVTVPKNSFTMATTATLEDYVSVPPALLAMVTACCKDLEILQAITPAQCARIADGCLGSFVKPVQSISADAKDVTPIVHLIDNTRSAISMGAGWPTGPTGAVIQFPVDGTNQSVILDARVAKTGPYVLSRLVADTDTVLMRHETPRLNSPYGVYLFPMVDSLVVLRIIF
jgi:hypothetical protein